MPVASRRPTRLSQQTNARHAPQEAYPDSALYLQKEATKPKAVSMSPNYEILHFAVHGELKEDDPLGSGLLLAGEGEENGQLSAREMFSLHLKADTVVLSACETGLRLSRS
ncbi:MAG: CHAT domain-containing protein [Deltaproteobacteria bacterium]|nr:CHAT domain-containing protein [Deltaproteobacteria bacterium]